MATDSTTLPQGDAHLDSGTDMSASELDLTAVQLAQSEPAQWVDLPQGDVVILLPVQPGQTVRLPTASAAGLLARLGAEGNLAIVVDGRTIILQGFAAANDESPVKIVTNDGDTIDVAELIAATDPSLDIQTAAGPATGGQGEGAEGSGIYVPFTAGPGLGGLDALGVLDPTALQYRLIDDEHRLFTQSDTAPDFTITFDILGGIVNEDDLPADAIERDVQTAKFVFKEGGNYGEGNDPFDTTDREDEPGDEDGVDDNGNDADPDREPLSSVATVKVDFHGDVPGKLELDISALPTDLTSEGGKIVYALNPAVVNVHGNGIYAFVESGDNPGYQDGEDRLVFEVHVDKYSSDSEFKVTFTLHDNIDNAAPDLNGDNAPDLLGANEQLLDLPVHFKITDSDGSSVFGTLPLGVQDDVPAFGEVVGVGDNMEIVDTFAEVTHDESKWPQSDDGADDQLFELVPFPPFILASQDLKDLAADLAEQVFIDAGFGLPLGSEGILLGVAQTQVKVSFGADGASQEHGKLDNDPAARDSIFGAINGTGENERPFELFMIDPKKGNTPSEDNQSTVADEGNLTVSEQKTNATVTWNGAVLPVYVIQIDPNTIVGYIKTGQQGGEEIQALGIGAGKEAVFVIDIDDAGVLSFFQLHQINHPDTTDHDESFRILAEDGVTPLVHVRATDFDGDHATQPVAVQIQDDGPCFVKVDWGNDCDATRRFNGTGLIDEDALPNGIYGGPGDNDGGRKADGKVVFDFGVDKPGHVDIQALTVKDQLGNVVLGITLDGAGNLVVDPNNLKAIDNQSIVVQKSLVGDNVVWTAYIADDEGNPIPGEKVFTFSLDTQGGNIGQFDFCLHQPLEHPLTDNPYQGGTQTSYEDNFKFDFTVRGYDVDGDHADGHVKLSVDDDSPDACKVEISFGNDEQDTRLVHDETAGVQDGDNDIDDPDATDAFQAEDDVAGPLPAFNGLGLTALGFAATQINVDLSGGNPPTSNAAYGADGPGTTSVVSILNAGGGAFSGEKTNLHDTETGQSIFLYTEGDLVVGRVGGAGGDIAFALHIADGTPAQLELAQYRAIEHDDPNTRDESVTLLDCNNETAVIYLQVTVTDADGDAVTVTQPVDGCEGNPAIVFQDDGPVITVQETTISLAVDESVGGDGTDLDAPEADGDQDGPAIENDETQGVPTALAGLGTVIGAATAQGSTLFTYDAGTDQEQSHTYSLKIDNINTGLTDTAKGQPITLSNAGIIDGVQVIQGKNTDGNIIFAISIDPQSGQISIAQYLAIDHGDTEGAPGAHDELARLATNVLSVELSVTDKDGDTVTASKDISGAVTFDDDAPEVTIGTGTLSLAMDESFSVNFDDYDDPNFDNDGVKDGSVVEADALVHFFDTLLAGLGFPPFTIGAAKGNVQGLFAVDYGSDKAGDTSYALQITALNGLTDLRDTATGELIKLVNDGGIIKGVTETSEKLVFAVAINPDTGDIVSAQYRAVDHGDEEAAPGAHDEVAFLTDGSLAVVATATDKDGDSHSKSVDISHAVSFDDDGPKFHDVDGDDDVDEDALDNGVAGGDGDDASGTSADGDIDFFFGSDGPGKLSIEGLTVKDSANNTIVSLSVDGNGDLVGANNLKTADGQPIIIDRSGPDASGDVTWTGYVDLGGGNKGAAVFTFELDTQGGELGEYEFEILEPLQHPFQDKDSENNGPQTSWEDNLNFDFTIRGTDGDGDSDIGHIEITVDDDSPRVRVNEAKLDLRVDETSAAPGTPDVDAIGGPPTQDGTKPEGDEGIVLPAALTNPAFGTIIGAVQASGASAFSINAGADGAQSIVYGLSIQNANSGLTDTLSGQAITLVNVGGVIQGQIPGGTVVFALTVDPNSGQISMAQYRAVHHGVDLLSGLPDEVIALASNKIELTVTVTDKDGDSVTKEKDLGGSIRFEDDGPTANDDDDSVTEDGPLLAFGNVVTGVDGGLGTDANPTDGVADAPGNDGFGSISWVGEVAGAIDTAYGKLFVDGNGNYKYELDNAAAQGLKEGETKQESFDYVIADKDGDTATATLKITITGKNDSPSVEIPNVNDQKAVVSDEGLPGNNADGTPAPDDETNSTTATGSIVVSDPDIGDTLTLAVLTDGLPALKFGGETVVWSVDVSGHVLHGKTDGTDAITVTITSTGTNTYDYEVELLKPLDHPDGTQEDEVDFNVTLKVTDSLGASDTALLNVEIEDDSPNVSVSFCGGFLLQVDETVSDSALDADENGIFLLDGFTPEGDEAQDPAQDNVVATGLGALGTAIGAATANAGNLFSVAPGADGEKSRSFDLEILAPGLTGLLDTATGDPIELVEQGGYIKGRVVGTHELVFALHIDAATGQVTMAQYRAVDHGTDGGTSYPDEVTFLGTGVLQVKLTVTDNDNDSDSESVDLGQLVTFDDDGPKADLITLSVDKSGDGKLVHDETAGVQDGGDGPNDPDFSGQDEDDVATRPSVFDAYESFNGLTAIGYASVSVEIGLTDGVNPNAAYGSDGPGITTIALTDAAGASFDGDLSNLTDTATGRSIFLYSADGLVVGRVGGIGNLPDPTGAIAFVLSIDNDSLDVAQYRAIQHPVPTNDDESVTLGSFGTQLISLVNAKVTVTDEDGDSVSKIVPFDGLEGRPAIVFQDDGPDATLAINGGKLLVLDETVGGAPNDNDEAASADPDDIGFAALLGSELFSATALHGTDGPGIAIFALNLNFGSSGLFDTETGFEVALLPNGPNQVIGWVGAAKVFTIDIDPVSGNVEVHQYRAVKHGNPNDPDESATPETIAPGLVEVVYTVTDKDGDSDIAKVDLGSIIKFEDDGPKADLVKIELEGEGGDGNLIHDETAGDDGNDDVAGPLAVFNGLGLTALGFAQTNVTIDLGDGVNPDAAYGSDGPGTTELSLTKVGTGGAFAGEQTNLRDTATTNFIFLWTEGDLVLGRVGADQASSQTGDIAFAISIDDSGTLSLAQYRAIQHPLSPANHDEPVTLLAANGTDALVQITAKVTDEDGDHVTVNLPLDGKNGDNGIIFEDDGPSASLTASGGFVVVDETVGGLPNDNDETGAGANPGDIGFAQVNAGALFVANAGGGADGLQSAVFSLEVGALPSGLVDTQLNQAVVFSLNGDVVEGRAGAAGPLVVTIAIDAVTGAVEVHQLRAVKHNDLNDPDEAGASAAGIAPGVITVVYTTTDGDNDQDTATFDLGARIRFEDDGPKAGLVSVTIGAPGDALLVHDETAGVQDNGNSAGDPDASGVDEDDVAIRPSVFNTFESTEGLVGTQLGYASTSVAIDLSGGNILTPNAAYGSDGPGETTIALTDNAGNPFDGDVSNLLDTATGEPIFLYTEGGIVVGRVGNLGLPDSNGEIAFAIAIDGDSLDLAQYRAIKHADPNNADDAATLLSGAGAAPTGLVFATIKVTDEDGDSVTKSIPLDGKDGNPAIVFQDDGPAAADDTDSVKEGDPAPAIGNVVTGANLTSFGSDANLTDGNADAGGTDGLNATSVVWTDAGEGSGKNTDGTIVGQYGTLYVDADGDYKYVLDQSNPDVIKLGKDETITEDFLYTVADKDGDRDEGKLTITIVGKDSPVTITNLTPKAEGGDTVVDEQGLPIRNLEPAGSGEAADGNGTDNDDTSETNTDFFTIDAPDGVKDLKVGGVSIISNGTYIDEQVIDTPLGKVIVKDYDAGTGKVTYEYTLEDNAIHPNADGENSVFEDLTVELTDVDGSAATGTLSIRIVDDLPLVTQGCGVQFLAVDETLGGSGDHPDATGTRAENDETLVTLPAALTNPAYGTVLGAAEINTSGFFSVVPGADGLASSTWSLTIENGGATGLTDTATNTAIVLMPGPGGVVEGRANGGAGPVVFALSVDNSGEVSIAQYRAVVHGNAASHDDVALLPGDILSVTLSVVDNDGDPSFASHPISQLISFDDDGPKLVDGSVQGSVEEDDINSIVSVGNNEDFSVGKDVAQGSLTALVNFGSDGAATGGGFSLDPAAIATLTSQGLTSKGIALTYSIVGDTLTASAGAQTVFTLKVEADGDYTFTLVDQLDHHPIPSADDIEGFLTISLGGVVKATDKDGDSLHLGDNFSIKVQDDIPTAFNPEDKSTGNSAGAAVIGDLDFLGHVGTDEPATITFTGFTDGAPALDVNGDPIKSEGEAVFLHGAGTGIITGKTADNDVIFTVTLNPGADTYSFNLNRAIDDGGGVVFTNLSGGKAGQKEWARIDNLDTDLLVTPIDQVAGTINTDVDDIGVADQFIDKGEGVRIDFVKSPAGDETVQNGYSFANHYLVNETSFSIIGIGGGGTASLKLRIVKADDDTNLVTGTDPQDVVALLSASGIDIDNNSGGAAPTITDLGGGYFQIDGLDKTDTVTVTGDEAYNRLEIEGLDGKQFSIGALKIGTIVSGDPVTMNFDVKLTDKDGDSTTADFNVTVIDQPVTITDLTPKAEGGDAVVDEEALSDGTNPASNAEFGTGSFKVSAPDGLDDVTISDGNETITIVNNGVFQAGQFIGSSDLGNKLEITGFNSGTGEVSYKYTLTDNEKHPDGNGQNSLFDDFAVKATDKDGDQAASTLSVKIIDDVPVANPLSKSILADNGQDTNLLITLDVSGSMNDPSGMTGLNKLEAAIASIKELIEQYDALGNVKVRIVTFSSNAQEHGTQWMTVEQARDLLDTLSADGSTNYDEALEDAMGAFPDTGAIPGAQNVAYFLSDGNPNRPDGDEGINGTEESDWINFLKGDDINSFALGFGEPGDVDQSELDPIAYNGKTETNTDGQVVTDLNQLTATLVATVTPPVAGNVKTDGGNKIGADNPGIVSQITFGGNTFVFNGATITRTIGSLAFGASGSVLTFSTPNGTLQINMSTGAYTYALLADAAANDTFGYTLTDTDGDSVTSTLQIAAAVADIAPIVRDDYIIAGHDDGEGGESIIVPAAALLWNDSDANGDPITVGGTFTNVDDLAGTPTLAGGNVTIPDGTEGGSFTYTGNANSKSDTGDVILDRDQAGDTGTIHGDGLDNIIVSDGTSNTLNGYEGNDVLLGNGGDDTLNGGAGRDWLVGGAGNDLAIGGAGNDLIDVSEGNDTVRYTSALDGYDVISGFDATGGAGNQDFIDLNQLFDDNGNPSKSTRDSRVNIQVVGSDTVITVDANGNGFDANDVRITVLGVTGLTKDDNNGDIIYGNN